MGFLDEAIKNMKAQPGKRYRWTRLDNETVARRKFQGHESVSSQDPAVKGTILEKHLGADGIIKVGNLGLMQTSEENARKIEKVNSDKLQKRLDAIKRSYQEDGEKIKRELGKNHSAVKIIAKEEE